MPRFCALILDSSLSTSVELGKLWAHSDLVAMQFATCNSLEIEWEVKRARLRHVLCSLDFSSYFKRVASYISAKPERALVVFQ